jgi:hypothetical protein
LIADREWPPKDTHEWPEPDPWIPAAAPIAPSPFFYRCIEALRLPGPGLSAKTLQNPALLMSPLDEVGDILNVPASEIVKVAAEHVGVPESLYAWPYPVFKTLVYLQNALATELRRLREIIETPGSEPKQTPLESWRILRHRWLECTTLMGYIRARLAFIPTDLGLPGPDGVARTAGDLLGSLLESCCDFVPPTMFCAVRDHSCLSLQWKRV